ncbi:MAG TPA: hypothetical protein VNN21_00765 [Dehalococcoidia bacterium]|nr:hypothetical protein [Dehalococcoidia bacterium]
MKAESADGKHLPYVLVKPDNYTDGDGWPLVVLLHGFGASMYDLAGLAPSIDGSGYVYAFPNAPFTVDLGGGAVGYSWALGRPGVQPPEGEAPNVEALLDGFLEELKERTGASPGSIVLGGFSQGAGLSLRYGLPRPGTFAGIAVLSGFFRDADALRPLLPEKRDMPVFLAHGRHDMVVALEMAHQTRAFLEEAGYVPEYHEYDMAHQITPDVIDDLKAWLRRVLPPRR